MSLPYRPNVGIALFNAQGLVFAGRSHSAGPEIVLPERVHHLDYERHPVPPEMMVPEKY